MGLIETNCRNVALVEGGKAGVERRDRAINGDRARKRDAAGADCASHQIQNERHPGRSCLWLNSRKLAFPYSYTLECRFIHFALYVVHIGIFKKAYI